MIEGIVYEVMKFLKSGNIDEAKESHFLELLVKKPEEFTRLMVILKMAHEAVREDKFITKRSIYYSNPVLFKRQSIIDPLLSKICKELSIPRCALKINASSKLIVYGDIYLGLGYEGDVIKRNNLGIPESLFKSGYEVIISECLPQFILIIEKDTIFRKLLNEKFYEKFKPCLLVTAKGYPDLITRKFLAQINCKHPNIPIIGLFDADPHGLNVFCTYKYGTTNPMMQNEDGNPISIPNLQLCGLLPTEISFFQIKETDLLKLTKRDKSLLNTMLKRSTIQHESILLKQINYLLFTEIKAQLEILNTIHSNYLTNEYLPNKLELLLGILPNK
uniref:DNA topoisomerase (ATP-hydrolyzing) n=1 Tax=Schistosoma mansoni TaxID=6183 RepID=A0A5K4F934_SCHMA